MSLATHGLTRKFGDLVAADNVSFSVKRGRLTGFVGANGAGKTTVMRMILGVLGPNAGYVTLDGENLDQATRRTFGYMPEERGLYPKMRLREQMMYFASLHGLSPDQAAANTDELLEVLGLTARAEDPIENLSLGNQQRAQIAVSLVHDPTALILDEPFSGLDPMAVDVIVEVLHDRARQGLPILLSSHQLDVVERLCDDLVVIASGQIKEEGPIDALRERHSRHEYRLDATGDLEWVRGVPGVEVVDIDSTGALLRLPADTAARDEMTQRVLTEALARNRVKAFTPQITKLSEIFREVVEAPQDEVAIEGASK